MADIDDDTLRRAALALLTACLAAEGELPEQVDGSLLVALALAIEAHERHAQRVADERTTFGDRSDRDRLVRYDALAADALAAILTRASEDWPHSSVNPDVCQRLVDRLADLAPDASDA